ncbi:MAG: aldehyde ferredoxin oxidoreductase family protein [Syntrophobacteraceae bacterium]|jgi:aldehyde:ferredoxin oxidoreductase|nr:aldehyde ferredoxin oxidoreductase family protein [Syntrophobacteraceae bacterium]
MDGWQGIALSVDLTRRQIDREVIDPLFAEQFIGGRGFTSRRLLDRIRPGMDPLSPENVLCFGAGPFSGTSLAMSSRIHVSTLSSYSGILGDGNAGGGFAYRLKRAGYDLIVVTGRSETPVYLWIQDDAVQLIDASDLWGSTTWRATDLLRRRHGSGVSVAIIGQAGENLVRVASTIVDKYASAARGSGAVWGSKNLKAVVVSGSGRVSVADPETFERLAREDREFFLHDPAQRGIVAVYGSHIGMTHWQPSRRYFERKLEPHEVPAALTPEGLKRFETGRTGCHGCPVGCKNIYSIPEGTRKGEKGSALEFECLDCLGTNCGIEDPVAILEMQNLADAYGLDVIALGNTIAFVKHLYNRGILTEKDTGGLRLDWNDAASQIELVHRTALREGFGGVVAEGLHNTARILGSEAMEHCHHVKGLSRGVHPPGVLALAHAVSTRGADHLRGRSWAVSDNAPGDVLPALVEKGFLPAEPSLDPVKSLIIAERATTLADAVGRCKGAVNSWVSAVPLVWKYPLWEGLARLLTAATGVSFDAARLEAAADRIQAVERAFNCRQGTTAEDDRLPQKPDMKNSPEGKAELERHGRMLVDYCRMHGYDPRTGAPTRRRLVDLNLEALADALERDAPYSKWNGPPLRPLESYPRGGRRA